MVEEIRKLVNIHIANEVRQSEYIIGDWELHALFRGVRKRIRLRDRYMARAWQTTSLE